MGIVTCRVYTLDTTALHDPIASVGVRIFDATGTILHTSGVTNASGYFQFDIDGSDPPTNYQVRCYKLTTGFTNPEYISVYDPLPPATVNNFNIYGNIYEVENSTDPRRCRATGTFVDPGGQPIRDLIIRFANIADPSTVDTMVVSGAIEVRTDSSGYAAVELFRTGKYIATISGYHDESLQVLVPDRAGVSLVDLLFQVVASVTFSPAAPWTVASGSTLTVTPTVTTSAYAVLTGTASGDVQYATGDTSIATVAIQNDVLVITGHSPGSTTLDLTRIDTSIHRIPSTTIVGTGGVITVS